MLLTRELINKNIKFHNCIIHLDNKQYLKRYQHDYSYLSSLIDAYKNLFLSKGAKAGSTVVIGSPASIEQIAITFACAELGIIITIVDETPIISLGQFTEQYKNLLPIDFFILSSDNNADKFKILKDNSNITIILDNENLDFAPNNIILASKDSIFLRCANFYGEIIEHTHKFLSSLSKRNSLMFSGTAAIWKNLNHGSSCATYFLPILISENITDLYNITNNLLDLSRLFIDLNSMDININHFLIPRTSLIDEILLGDYQSMPKCIIYTLGIIKKKWTTTTKVKDIISLFGTSKTSGPLLINKASDTDFKEDTYKKIDDFYGLELSKNGDLEVYMPVYNTKINIGDKFVIKDEKYVFYTLPKIYRINEFNIYDSTYRLYNDYINQLIKGDLVIDTFKNNLYLAVWDNNITPNQLHSINDFLKKNSETKLYIENYAILNYNDFHIDNNINIIDLLQYFRELGE